MLAKRFKTIFDNFDLNGQLETVKSSQNNTDLNFDSSIAEALTNYLQLALFFLVCL